MSGPLRFYFDFTCPYAYLGSVVVGPRAAASGLEVVAEPVLLGGILRHYEVPQAPAQHMPAPKLLHGDQDIRRLASILEAPYERPPRHPQRSVEALRCVLALQDTGLDPWDFIHRTYRAYWAEGRDISSEDTLRACLRSYEDPSGVLDRIRTDAMRSRLHQVTSDAIQRGVFGVPTFALGGKAVWGVDRLHTLLEGPSLLAAGSASHEPSTVPPAFYFDYSSPFAAVASARVERELGADTDFRPMLLGAVFRAVGTPMVPISTFHPAKRQWARDDLARQARECDFPLTWPSRFPMNTVLPLRATLAVGPNTPEGRALVHGLYRAYWAHDRDISDPEVVRAQLSAAGVDADEVLAACGTQDVKDHLRRSTDKAIADGVFGAPSFVVTRSDGAQSLFWGSDRLEMAAALRRGDRRVA